MNKSIKHSISLCLGSSCFANGNSALLTQIKDFLQKNKLTESVEIKGSLCQGHCIDGPTIIIDGTLYLHLCSKSLDEILSKHLLNPLEIRS
jgi:NADH:ubiquinone oxidoreductase subunit E